MALWCTCQSFTPIGQVLAADPPTVSPQDAERLYWAGDYEGCRDLAQREIEHGVWNERWSQWRIQSLLALGEYESAVTSYEQALARYGDRIGIRYLGYDVFRRVGQVERAEAELTKVLELFRTAAWRYGTASDQVLLGRFLVHQGEDARQILEQIYDPLRQRQPNLAEVQLAAAELALDKHDAALALEYLERAAKLQPNDPLVWHLQALAWEDRDGRKAHDASDRALSLNARFVPAILWQAERAIDGEQYAIAKARLNEALSVNLREPRAWALHAVLAHVAGHFRGEEQLVAAAQSCWGPQADVPYWVGWKLSQKYRFREGAAYQRRALALQPTHAQARFALAQDLLRLGEETEGWLLAADVRQRDPYHVVAFNLMELRAQLDRFATMTNERFIVRMERREADVYGERVLAILDEAHQLLCAKYAVTLSDPVTVEIFPRQQDFAIRTFGLPGGTGYLGVCFGRLITANSPASRGVGQANWQSVLWHEFCHVVTLEKTQNRMPRWLSEGISVYEERQRDRSWGQSITPTYRAWLLDEHLTPVSRLSESFLQPASPQHLQFAYFESSLVVEYLWERLGAEGMQRLLTDLGAGLTIEQTLERYCGSLAELDRQFVDFARQRAESWGKGLDWRPAEDYWREILGTGLGSASEDNLSSSNAWDKQRASLRPHYITQLQIADELRRDKNWSAIVNCLARVWPELPEDVSEQGAGQRLAEAYRQLGDSARERAVLEVLVEHSADGDALFERLGQLAREANDWPLALRCAQKQYAVNPLRLGLQEQLAAAAQRVHQDDWQLWALQAQLALDPWDRAQIHYEMANAAHRMGDRLRAKRYVLMALELSPRYRAAQRLLLELVDGKPAAPTAVDTREGVSP